MAPPNLECRMYERKYPEENTVVMVKTSGVSEIGTSVTLLEYNNIDGLIFFTDPTSNYPRASPRPRRFRSVSSLFKCQAPRHAFKFEAVEPASVLRVNGEKGCIYLSKKVVSEEDAIACKKRYYKSTLVHAILRQVAGNLSIDLEELYKIVGWPLYQKYGHAFNAFKLIAKNPNSILDSLTKETKEVTLDGREVMIMEYAVSEQMKNELVKSIRNFIEIIRAFRVLSPLDPKAFSFEDLD